MSIYERPTKSLMADWAKEHLTPGQIFNKAARVQWFTEHYPKIKRNTVGMHVDGMSINNRNRKHHSNIKPGSGHDLFYKLGPDQFRLWVPNSDPPPLYKDDIEKQDLAGAEHGTAGDRKEDEPNAEAAREFAYERDLRNYLIRNLGLHRTWPAPVRGRRHHRRRVRRGRAIHRHSRRRQGRSLCRRRAESLARVRPGRWPAFALYDLG